MARGIFGGNPMQIAGSTVLLTGATGGIGEALARELHARGARLVLTGRRLDVLTPLAEELGARAIVADMALRSDVLRLITESADVDILIANAALPASGHLLELTQPQIDTMLEVNLRAPVALARALGAEMAARGRGHIVLMSSLSGKAATPLGSIYSATKFGLRGFAQGARADLRPAGVGVSVILAGFVRGAGMFVDSGARLPPGVGTNSLEEVIAGVIRAIERDRGEITIAPLGLRLGADIAAVAPGLAAFGQRLAGGSVIARRISDGQHDKRPDER